MIKNDNCRSFSEIKNQMLKDDKELKREYEVLRPRYDLISKAIDARLKEKMTQEEVAIKMGTTTSSISRFESGDYNPSFDFLVRLTNALGKELKVSIV